jgi:hypothetical protein
MTSPSEASAPGPRAVALADALAGTDRLELLAVDDAGQVSRTSGPFLVADGGLVTTAHPGFGVPPVPVVALVRGTPPPATVAVAVTVDRVLDEQLCAHFARALPVAAPVEWLVLRPIGPAIERAAAVPARRATDWPR